ncbi:cohesin domain-containing protein [Chloroflexota bacterium]
MIANDTWFPEITLNPNMGKAGTKVNVVGTDFPANADVNGLWFAGEPQPIPPGTVADSNGDFTLVFNVPDQIWGAPIGWGMYPVGIDCGGIYIEKPFEATAADIAFTIWADPPWLPPIAPGDSGTTVVRIESLGAGLTVNLSVENIPFEVNWSFSPATVTVSPGGKASSTLTLSPSPKMWPGHYFADIKGVSGVNEFWTHVEFDVEPPGGFKDIDWMQQQGVWFPEITLNPSTGKAGAKVTVAGTDFPGNADVTGLWFAGEPQPIPPGTVADSNGDFTLVFNVPQTLWGMPIGFGMYPVDVEAQAPGIPPVFITKPFEVTSSEQVSFNMYMVPEWIPGIEQGSSGNTTVTVESASQEVTVELSVDGLPSGASAQFSPSSTVTAPPGGKSSATITISTSASTPPGKYPLSIKGVSGNNVRIINFGFGIMMPASFQIPELTLDPDFVPAGYGDKKMKIAFSGTGFPADAAVSMKFAGDNITLPTGFMTDNTGSFNGVFQLPIGLDHGTYTVAAIAGGKKDVKPFTIKALESTFILDPSPPFLPPILQGTSANATVTVTSVATANSTVILSIDGLPDGVSTSFLPSDSVTAPPGASTSTTVTINVGTSTLPGMYPLNIIGVSGNETASVPFGFGVMTDIGAGLGYATITINPPSGNPESNITIAGAGFTENEIITLTAAPRGAVTPVDITPGNISVQPGGIWSTQMTIPPVDQVPPGIYIIKATDGFVSAKADLDILPEEAAALTLGLSPAYLKVTQGGSGNVTLTVNSQNAFKEPYKLGVGGLAPGVIVTFTDAQGNILAQYAGSPAGGVTTIVASENVTPVPGESLAVTVKVEVDVGAALGPHDIPMEAKYNPTIVKKLNLTVVPAAASLVLSPNSGTADTDAGFSGAGFSDNETIAVSFGNNVITTIPAAITTAADGTFTGMITIPDISPGIYSVTATGGTSNTIVEASFTLKPSAADTFALSAKPAQLAIPTDRKGSFTLTVEPSGSFNSEVSLALKGLDAVSTNATYTFTPASGNITPAIGTPVSASLEIANLDDAQVNTYPLTVTATAPSENITQSVKVNLKVIPDTADFSIAVAPVVVVVAAGSSANTAVSLIALNGFDGTVNLAVSGLPDGISYNANATSIPVAETVGTGMATETITFNMAADTEPGISLVEITGTSLVTHSAEVILIGVPEGTTTGESSSATADPSSIGLGTPMGFSTGSGDNISFSGIIGETTEPLSVLTKQVGLSPADLANLQTGYQALLGYVLNIETSSPSTGATWDFTPNFDLATGVTPKLVYLHVDNVTGAAEWKEYDAGLTLRLVPSTTDVATDSTITVDIQVDTDTQPVAAVDAYINFIPAFWEATSITPNHTTFETPLLSQIDNARGRVNYSAGHFGSPAASGNFTIATINFRCKLTPPMLLIRFNRSGSRVTRAAYEGSDVLGAIFDADNRVTYTNLSHTSAWALLGAGGEQQPDLIVSEKHEVWVDEEAETYIVHFTVKNVGSAEVSGYDVTLSVDGSDNETITVNQPLAALASRTGQFSLLILSGESDNITVTVDKANAIAEVSEDNNSLANTWQHGIIIRLVPTNETALAGEVFTFTIEVRPSGQKVSAVDACLNFDSEVLQVVDPVTGEAADNITPENSVFEATLYNVVNNSNGQITYSAGTLLTPEPTDNFTLARITFKALKEATNTMITFSLTPPRETIATYKPEGAPAANYLVSAQGATVGITHDVPVELSGAPETTYVDLGFTVDIVVNRGGKDNVVPDAAAVYLNYDSTYLQVTQIDAGTALTNVTTSTYGGGQVDYAADTDGGAAPSDNFTLATIHFMPLQETSSANITFSWTDPRKCSLTYQGNLVYGSHGDEVRDLPVESGSTIHGTIILQGGGRPEAEHDVNLDVKLFVAPEDVWSGTSTANYTYTPGGGSNTITITDTNYITHTLSFDIAGVAPGTYDITIVSDHTLMNVTRGVAVTPPEKNANFGTLHEGNCNNDRQVNSLDFSVLAQTYFKSDGDPGWNSSADFDESGQVNSLDFSLLAGSYFTYWAPVET